VDWLNSQAAVWYEEGISKLVSRYDKCLNVQDDYVEKYVKVCDKTCIFFFFPIINKYFLMAKRSLLSRCPSYTHIRERAHRFCNKFAEFIVDKVGFTQILTNS
jgi:hypothetical protein